MSLTLKAIMAFSLSMCISKQMVNSLQYAESENTNPLGGHNGEGKDGEGKRGGRGTGQTFNALLGLYQLVISMLPSTIPIWPSTILRSLYVGHLCDGKSFLRCKARSVGYSFRVASARILEKA